jgi:CHAT domain-containing protein
MSDSDEKTNLWQNGLKHYFARDYQSALSYFDEFDKTIEMETLGELHKITLELFASHAFFAAYQVNNFTRALYYASKECDFTKAQPSLYARALNNKGLALLDLGCYAEAESNLNEAKAILDTIRVNNISTLDGYVEELTWTINHNLQCLRYLRNPSQTALNEFSETLTSNYLTQKSESSAGYIWSTRPEYHEQKIVHETMAKAESAIKAGDIKSAVQIYEREITDLREGKNVPKALGILQSNLGNLFLNTEDFDNAVRTLEAAVASLEQTSRPSEPLALALNNLSVALNRQGDKQRAIDYAKRSWLEIKETGVNTLITLSILYHLAFLRVRENDHQRARAVLYHAIEIYDENRKFFAASEAAHAGPFSTYRRIIELMLLIALNEQWSDEVLNLIERAKARYWNEHIEKLLLVNTEDKSESEKLREAHEISMVNNQITDMRCWMINFFTGPNYIFVVSSYNGRTSSKRHDIDENQLYNEVSNFLKDIQSSSRRELWRESGKRLSSLLFEGIEIDGKEPKQIQIIPDGALWYLPFDFLPYPENMFETVSGEHLFNKSPIVHIPSAKLLDQYRSKKITNSKPSVLVIAKSHFTSELFPLGSVNDEIEAIEQMKDRCSIITLKENNATKKNVLSHIEKADIIHVSTHALSNPQEELSAIVLSDETGSDVHFLASEIAELKMKAQVVFLSACSSAVGRISLGEGLTSIGRAFLMAGCKSVVASLWSVLDKEAPIFVNLFYSELFNGRTPSESLRLAKKTAIEKKLSNKTIATFQIYGGIDNWMTLSSLAQELISDAREEYNESKRN